MLPSAYQNSFPSERRKSISWKGPLTPVSPTTVPAPVKVLMFNRANPVFVSPTPYTTPLGARAIALTVRAPMDPIGNAAPVPPAIADKVAGPTGPTYAAPKRTCPDAPAPYTTAKAAAMSNLLNIGILPAWLTRIIPQ